MEQEYPLAYLAQMVASTLGQERPTRLALHNTDRFGLVHLYFAHGRLSRVEGHRGSPLASLSDLATWRAGTIRRDYGASAAVSNAGPSEHDTQLAQALTEAIRTLEANGVIRPAGPGTSHPGTLGTQSGPLRRRTPHTRPGSSPLPPYPHTLAPRSLPVPGSRPPIMPEVSQVEYMAGLPPLAGAALPPEPPASVRDAEATGGALLSRPQWQLIALVTRQVVEQAGQQIGQQLAENLLRQALGQTAASKEPLRIVEIDSTGWLQTVPSMEGKTITDYPTTAVTDAVAALLTNYEQRCAALVGAAQAQQIIAVATGPFRASLAQIGLVVADEANENGL
ncbi:MAG: hypothetical protein ACXVDA_16800 [Ktedonobacterales bacterium]